MFSKKKKICKKICLVYLLKFFFMGIFHVMVLGVRNYLKYISNNFFSYSKFFGSMEALNVTQNVERENFDVQSKKKSFVHVLFVL